MSTFTGGASVYSLTAPERDRRRTPVNACVRPIKAGSVMRTMLLIGIFRGPWKRRGPRGTPGAGEEMVNMWVYFSPTSAAQAPVQTLLSFWGSLAARAAVCS